MFASRYFADHYFAPRYFAKAGATPTFKIAWALGSNQIVGIDGARP